jgi:hypothetical protein
MDDSTESISIDIDNSMLFMIKMCFIYSALMDGWKVEKLSNNRISFSKKNIKKHFSIDSFLKRHVHITK